MDTSLLQKSIQRLGIADQVEAIGVLELFKQWVEKEFGAAVLNEVEPKWVKQGSLALQTENGALRAQIKNKEEELLQYIQKQKPSADVRRIRFVL